MAETIQNAEPAAADNPQDAIRQAILNTIPDEEAPETTSQEVGEEQVAEQAPVAEEEPLTPEKMLEMGIDKIDPKSIPDELLPFYKSMLSDYRKKTAEVANERRRIEEEARRVAQAQRPPKDINEAFQRDPQGTLRVFDEVIFEALENADKLDDTDPFAASKLRGQAFKLEKQRAAYREQFEQGVQQYQQMAGRATQAVQFVQREVPDIREKLPQMYEVAKELFGANSEAFAWHMDPTKNPNFVNHAIGLARLVDKVGKVTDTTKKVVSTPPVKMATPSPPRASKTVDMQAELNLAKQTGNWARYFEAKGMLE